MKNFTRTLAITSALVGLGYAASADTSQQQSSEGQQDMMGEHTLAQVYFDFDSDVPKGDLLMVANQLECTPGETIILDAYTDQAGSNTYNADLARRRAEAVRDRLVEYGIAEDRIVLGVFGEQGRQRETDALDRRVEVRSSAEPLASIVQKREGTAIAVLSGSTGEVESVAIP